jgi:hypothetical protein
MFRRNLMPVWVGTLFLSGIFLMGQDTLPPTLAGVSFHAGVPAGLD